MHGIDFGPNLVGLFLLLGAGLVGVAKDNSWLVRVISAFISCVAAAALGSQMY